MARSPANRSQENAHRLACAIAALSFITLTGCATPDPSIEIESVLHRQADAWNAGDINAFMEHYWRSDALTFSSGGHTRTGWTTTRDRYTSRYPDRAAMGELTFSDLTIEPLGADAAFVLGRWRLKRNPDPASDLPDIGGAFTLILRRFDGSHGRFDGSHGGWKIIHDHTSAEPTTE